MKPAIRGFFGDLLSDLLAEIFSIHTLKRFIRKGREETEKRAEAEKERIPEVKLGGMFDLSDERAFFALSGLLDAEPGCAKYSLKIAQHINQLPHEWQRRKFRASVGSLASITYTQEEVREAFEKESIPQKGAKPITRTKPASIKTEKKKNLGVEVLKSFAQLTPDEALEVMKASGIADSALDSYKKSWDKANKWAGEHKEEVLERIESARKTVETKPYAGFWRTVFGMKPKTTK